MTNSGESLKFSPIQAQIQTKTNFYWNTSPSSNQSYAPFLAKANRFSSSNQQKTHPAVGSYNVPSCFDKKRSLLEQRAYRFLMEAQKKKDQMNVFKSSLSRFDKVIKDAPGPASYNLFQNKQNPKEQRSLKRAQRQKRNSECGKSCPSIPNKDNKYGYAFANGVFKNIQKNPVLLQEERISRNHYLSTLEGERNFRESSCQGSVNDQRKRLYGQTQKVLLNVSASTSHIQKGSLVQKKPKFDHLYHSKAMPPVNQNALLGPGSYEINNGAFATNDKREKYQFFGSTEVRFKDKTNESEKGYSLIEMIKENKKTEQKERKSPVLSRAYPIPEKLKTPEKQLPGPGDYDPKDEHLKKSRGVALFSYSQRFQGMYPKPEEPRGEESPVEQRSRTNKAKCGKLKKDHFKTMHKVYQPVNSCQIGGILSQQSDGKENRGDADIKSWSRQEDRQKRGQYMKELKEQLAFISETPRNEALNNQPYNRKAANQKKV